MSIKNMESKVQRSKKIRKGDKVVVIAGSSKGQSGAVLRFVGERVVVQGLNLKKKHVKPSQQNPKGGIIEIEAPMHISNVCLADESGKPLKVKVERDKKGEGVLYFMQDKERVVYRSLKTPKK
jgi:large subunit ribosomal protein L24